MTTPSGAVEIVLKETARLDAVEVSLEEAVGGVLASPVASDIDLPPFDKSAMDGYAVRCEDLARLPVELTVLEDLPAGVAPSQDVVRGACARIMTGAPVPAGADVVVPVEDTQALSEGRVRILRADVEHRNICARGEDIRRGARVLEAGTEVRPQEVGLLATVGLTRVAIFRRPRVAVLATGDELVPPSAVPGPGQIRNANSSSLLACCRRAGVPADDLGVARDNKPDLRARIADGLQRDVLLVSGGVSMGEWDLVPGVFQTMGVTTHFASVQMKPGKPTIFATRDRKVIFGLPGNPVSTLVTFHLFVLPCLRKMMGRPHPGHEPVTAALTRQAVVRGDRTTFLPTILRRTAEGWTAEPVKTHGPADLVGFSRANALSVLEAGTYEAGTRVKVMPLES
jgi:molybdopterin molybdotransferase